MVIEDTEFTDLALLQDQINNFLREKAPGGNHQHIAYRLFEGKSAAEIIYQACRDNSINPKVILAKLQAEQGLINGTSAVNPSQTQLDRALGVGVYDDGTVNPKYRGFPTQIISAAQTLREHYDEAEKVNFELKNIDGEKFTVKNAATYSLYRYTPHISGIELYFNIYQTFFNAT